MDDRFTVSYPIPLVLGLGTWALLGAALHHSVRTGGWRLRHGSLDAGAIAGIVFLLVGYTIMGPMILFTYSSSLSVDGTTLVAKRFFGFRTRSFDRSDIREATIVRKGRFDAIALVLANGTRLLIRQEATNYSRLRRYLALDGTGASS